MTADNATPAPEQSVPWGSLYAAHLAALDVRLEQALRACGCEGLVIAAGEEKPRFRDDALYPFRPDPYFLQWVPLAAHPGCWLKLVPGERPMLAYLQSDDYWHAPPEDPSGFWVDRVDLHCVATREEARLALGDGLEHFAAIGEDCAPGAFESVNDPALLARLDYGRAAKTEYEIACIQQATRIGVLGHRAAERAFARGASEFEIHEAFLSATGQRECELPYLSIVALNRHAAVLHYQHLDRRAPRRAHSFLLDAGAMHRGYASDITRTYAGTDAEGFRSLIASMDQLQRSLCARVAPGVDFVSLNQEAHALLAEVMHEHGLLRSSPAEALARGVTRAFLPHGLGHLLGLQVHDVGGRLVSPDGATREAPPEHPFLRLTRRLEPGFVLTIEPGIYFIPSLLAELGASDAGRSVNWPAVEALVSCGGIRIEDNVLVTTKGARNLTREAWTPA